MVQEILSAALAAVDPYKAVQNNLVHDLTNNSLLVGDAEYLLDESNHIYLIGIGKAAAPMIQASLNILGDLVYAGIAVVKDGELVNLEVGKLVEEHNRLASELLEIG